MDLNRKDIDLSYLELDLPQSLQDRLNEWKKALAENERDRFDIYLESLMAEINSCEVENLISVNQANYLRRKYIWGDLE